MQYLEAVQRPIQTAPILKFTIGQEIFILQVQYLEAVRRPIQTAPIQKIKKGQEVFILQVQYLEPIGRPIPAYLRVLKISRAPIVQ